MAVADDALTLGSPAREAVQSGEVAYAADRAFTAEEVDVLGRCARVALLCDEPWLPETAFRQPDLGFGPDGSTSYAYSRWLEDFATLLQPVRRAHPALSAAVRAVQDARLDDAEATGEVDGRRWRARFFHSYIEGYAETTLAGTDQVRFDRREGGSWGSWRSAARCVPTRSIWVRPTS